MRGGIAHSASNGQPATSVVSPQSKEKPTPATMWVFFFPKFLFRDLCETQVRRNNALSSIQMHSLSNSS